MDPIIYWSCTASLRGGIVPQQKTQSIELYWGFFAYNHYPFVSQINNLG